MPVEVEALAWGGWPECYRVTNGTVEVIATAAVGPRILRYAFVGEESPLYIHDEDAGQTGGNAFRLYGGHRFWAAPEVASRRTYYPDNAPVTVSQRGGLLRLMPPAEVENGLQKELTVEMAATGTAVTVTHQLINVGRWPVPVAAWALTVMATGGRAVLPLPPRVPHPEALSPANNLAMWAYTDLSDPRWTFTPKYVLLNGQARALAPQKIGASVPGGWLAYVREGTAFVKRFAHLKGAAYPDMNSSAQMFTNGWMLELETLGPLQTLAPGEATTHAERWTLHADVPTPTTADDVDAHVVPLVGS